MPPKNAASSSSAPLSLQEAIRQSTSRWQANLDSLFQHAKDRFPDVVWELVPDDEMDMDSEDFAKERGELVWGHKAIVYARAPPSFQSRYFSFRPVNPYSPEPGYLDSSLTLSVRSRSPSPSRSRPGSRAQSLAPSVLTVSNKEGLLRLRTAINSSLFSNELEYLYTGQGFGEAFEFLFDTTPALESNASLPDRQVVSTPRTSLNFDPEVLTTQARVDKLRKDLVYMWRSRLYSDVRIALTGEFSSINHETSTAIFSSHRFILVSRCSYFKNVLQDWPRKKTAANEPITLTLPSPPFTPASLHFTLGYMYTGTLVFSHRTYDLSTALSLLKSANYLDLQPLYDEVQARIVQEMMHGLGHAFLEFGAYEEVNKGGFAKAGCRCRSCVRRAPRILASAVEPDLQNTILERGARRILVSAFGVGWCTSEFATLPPKLRESLLKGVRKRTTAFNPALGGPDGGRGNGRGNVFAVLWAAETALRRLQAIESGISKKKKRAAPPAPSGGGEDDEAMEEDDSYWIETVREMILLGRKGAEEVLAAECVECFTFPSDPDVTMGEPGDWEALMYSDGVGFDDDDRLTWTFDALKRGLQESNAAVVYQALVSEILIRSHPDHSDQAFLSPTSKVRGIVESARVDVLRWIRKRWINMAPLGAFESLEDWALKEISDSIEVPIEDLLLPAGSAPPRSSTHFKSPPPANDDEASSLHASLLPRTPTVTSTANSVRSTVSRRTKNDRPDSKFTPGSSSSATNSLYESGRRTPTHQRSGAVSPAPSPSGRRTPTHSRSGATSPSPSAFSTRSSARAGAISPSRRRAGAGSPPPPSPGIDRPSSAASSRSTATATTVRKSSAGSVTSSVAVARRAAASTASTVSTRSSVVSSKASTASSIRSGLGVRQSVASSAGQSDYKTASNGGEGSVRGRRGSVASSTTASIRSSVASPSNQRRPANLSVPGRQRQASTASMSSLSSPNSPVTPKRPGSVASSIRSTTSTKESPAQAARRAAKAETAAARQKPAEWTNAKGKEREKDDSPAAAASSGPGQTSSSITIKPKPRASNGPSTTTNTPTTSTLKRKGSSDTITSRKTGREPVRPPPMPSASASPRKVTPGSRAAAAAKKRLEKEKENKASSSSLRPAPSTATKDQGPQPPGATLEIGIPCIITSRRKRFKAYARYIGEVEGESGSWVGVEVPMDESWGEDELAGDSKILDAGGPMSVDGKEPEGPLGPGAGGRQWNDGTWGGIKYFDITASAEDLSMSRNRRGRDWSEGTTGSFVAGKKRPLGDSMLGIGSGRLSKRMRSTSPSVVSDSGMESRGLFVRPSQVLYVVDA
ncbi:hypothetical protein DL96DRAFT_1537120 [Flagelloscypha sp. PMI_526]|nr:hypothetical protein DL96DRAFT_1537120 [Flagelloscypha sp. PMI_526]